MFLGLEFTAPPEVAARRWTLMRAKAFIAGAVHASGLTAIDQIGGAYDGNVMLMQLIAESHIAVHLMRTHRPPYGAIHIFSCRDFDEAEMIRLTAEFFVADGGKVYPYSLPRGLLPEIRHG